MVLTCLALPACDHGNGSGACATGSPRPSSSEIVAAYQSGHSTRQLARDFGLAGPASLLSCAKLE